MVEELAWAKGRWAFVGCGRLSVRAHHWRSVHHNAGSATVVANWQILPVGHERLIWAEHAANVGGMKLAGVEIGVVANSGGHLHLERSACDQHGIATRVLLNAVCTVRQERRHVRARGSPVRGIKRHESVQRGHAERGFNTRGQPGKHAKSSAFSHIKRAVADRHKDARLALAVRALCNAPRQILNRKVSVSARSSVHPATCFSGHVSPSPHEAAASGASGDRSLVHQRSSCRNWCRMIRALRAIGQASRRVPSKKRRLA